jgi:hypothetical protein
MISRGLTPYQIRSDMTERYQLLNPNQITQLLGWGIQAVKAGISWLNTPATDRLDLDEVPVIPTIPIDKWGSGRVVSEAIVKINLRGLDEPLFRTVHFSDDQVMTQEQFDSYIRQFLLEDCESEDCIKFISGLNTFDLNQIWHARKY